MTNIVIIYSLIAVVICVTLLVAVIRVAYQAGYSEAERKHAQDKVNRAEDIARQVHDFNTQYADLTDEDLKHRLRNL